MTMPRSKYVQEGKEGVYHCFSRCVRRAFLYGYDTLTHRDFSHRKTWLVNRLKQLAGIFAVEVCAYAIMGNHYHTILRTRPDIVAGWSDREVATRWLALCPQRNKSRVPVKPTVEEQIRALVLCPERIETLRKRLSSLSWFMGRLNEFIARAANKEDDVKGRFWESRFQCQALLDDAAIATGMVYVDLNPIRAGMAGTPEGSDFTSIQERIRAWQKEMIVSASPGKSVQVSRFGSPSEDESMLENTYKFSLKNTARSDSWLCPIASNTHKRGILPMSATEYFDLVDRSGRMVRADKKGAIDTDLASILKRIGPNPDTWSETITRFGYKFNLVAGMISSLRNFADQVGKRWFKGIAAARVAFVTSPPQLT